VLGITSGSIPNMGRDLLGIVVSASAQHVPETIETRKSIMACSSIYEDKAKVNLDKNPTGVQEASCTRTGARAVSIIFSRSGVGPLMYEILKESEGPLIHPR
jgi:hypothetical protein